MTDEIIKLYKNAGIEKEVIKGCYEYYTENGGIDIYTVNDCKNKDCNTCKADKSIKEYPPFTAEKQLKICKLLLKLEHSISYYFYENRYGFIIDDKQDDCIEAEKFEIALAMIVNSLWQDLTEEEKEQIRSVLNG